MKLWMHCLYDMIPTMHCHSARPPWPRSPAWLPRTPPHVLGLAPACHRPWPCRRSSRVVRRRCGRDRPPRCSLPCPAPVCAASCPPAGAAVRTHTAMAAGALVCVRVYCVGRVYCSSRTVHVASFCKSTSNTPLYSSKTVTKRKLK
jgi:hypothetical protein